MRRVPLLTVRLPAISAVFARRIRPLHGWTAWMAVIALALAASGSASAQMYTGGCKSTAEGNTIKSLPTATLAVPGAAGVGDFVGGWYTSPSFYGQHSTKLTPVDFEMCVSVNSARNGGSNGADKNLYPVGIKPGAIIAAPNNLIVSDDGMTFRVWTTPQLRDSFGLGYIVRWRTSNTWGETGSWGTPPAAWGTVTGETATGLPFWRVHVFSESSAGAINNSQDVQAGATNTHYFNSLQDWYTYINRAVMNDRMIRLFYAVEVEVRWVVIGKVSQPLDASAGGSANVTLVQIQSRPNAQAMRTHTLSQSINVKLAPHGTCTTPSVTVPFNTLFASDLPTVGSTAGTKEFTFEFTKCPRVNIAYFFRAPAGIAVDNAHGVVGLKSAAGNAQGVGVQLAHNGGVAGTAPVQFNQDGNATVYTRSPGMGQDTPQGVNHSIPLRASIYRTSAQPIVPGKINAAVLVYVQYP